MNSRAHFVLGSGPHERGLKPKTKPEVMGMALKQIESTKIKRVRLTQQADPGMKAGWVNARSCPAAKQSTNYIDSSLASNGRT